MSVSRHDPSPDFRFGLGHLALEFVATLAGRKREPLDRLATRVDLSAWLEQAGLGTGIVSSEADLAAARELREAIYGLLHARRANRRARGADVATVNRFAALSPPVPQLDGRLRLEWQAPNPATAALAQIARAAVELLSSPDVDRIRDCADPTCSLMFIDHSRPGRRRWCSMDRCGNRTKTARYRHRSKSAAPAAKQPRRGLSP
jgi:predicted RNA-binding Zn ribbon-like protein